MTAGRMPGGGAAGGAWVRRLAGGGVRPRTTAPSRRRPTDRCSRPGCGTTWRPCGTRALATPASISTANCTGNCCCATRTASSRSAASTLAATGRATVSPIGTAGSTRWRSSMWSSRRGRSRRWHGAATFRRATCSRVSPNRQHRARQAGGGNCPGPRCRRTRRRRRGRCPGTGPSATRSCGRACRGPTTTRRRRGRSAGTASRCGRRRRISALATVGYDLTEFISSPMHDRVFPHEATQDPNLLAMAEEAWGACG